IATRGSIKQVEERQAADARRIAKQEEELRGLSDRLQGMRVQIEARVGEQGRLFGSVTAADIAEKLAAEVGEEIDRRKIELDEPIRTVGEHAVTIRLVGRLQPTINVVVWDPENPHASTSDEPVAEAESEDEAEDGEPDESVAVVVAEDENDTETE
ncbi:MAG TPA: 50S ribosomal protein L9, partial [Thermomicrobiales bacterium]|nr:50S ribosomal protein L9 [Thermomicrobiales bacterium]